MNETLRVPLSIASLMIYAGLVLDKARCIRRSRDPLDRRMLGIDLIRLVMDCVLLNVFLWTGLYPGWFGLFGKGPVGQCGGCVALISITLLFSVFVDWFILVGRQDGEKRPSFPAYLLKQAANVLLIECALCCVLVVFLVLEPTGAGVFVRLLAALLVLVLFRGLQDFVRYRRKKKEGI